MTSKVIQKITFLVLVREQRFAYWHELNNIVMGTVHVAFATAAQRAEAFLKTLNLWK